MPEHESQGTALERHGLLSKERGLEVREQIPSGIDKLCAARLRIRTAPLVKSTLERLLHDGF